MLWLPHPPRHHGADTQGPELAPGTGMGPSSPRGLSGLWPRSTQSRSPVQIRRPDVRSQDSGPVPGPASQFLPRSDPRLPYL